MPMYTGEGKARVINSVFFDQPPFFGFDIHPSEQWYHVIGLDHWVTVNGTRISPIIFDASQPLDSDTTLIHGHIEGEFLIASYVGFSDKTPYYYRSLLSADELRQDVLPEAYNGLLVWVRGKLDVAQGQGQFYSLPDGTWIDSSYLGQEALLAGTLSMGERIQVQVSRGVFLRSGSQYSNIWMGQTMASTNDRYIRGSIRSFGAPDSWLELVVEDGSSVQVDLGSSTRIEFADGSEASLGDLSSGQIIEVAGQGFSGQGFAASKVSIVSMTTSGAMYAAYVTPDGSMWSVDLNSQAHRRIAELAGPDSGLGTAQFAPDGQRLAFARSKDGMSTLVIGDLLTGMLTERLTEDDWQEADPVWSPDGSRIAVCRFRNEGGQLVDGGLWVLKLQDGTARRVGGAAPPGWRTVQPRWSPNGKHIAYGHSGESPSQATTLYVLSFPPRSQWVLDWVWDWRWSPDSSHILTSRQTSEEAWARLWVVQRDGTSPTWLSTRNVHDYHGRWSPDGTAIAFLSRSSTSRGPDALWIMQADGMRRFQPSGSPLASDLAWSPDSQAVVFLRVSVGGQGDGLWIVNRHGSDLRQLAPDATALGGTFRQP
jgi:Tol biopolymer transport system component